MLILSCGSHKKTIRSINPTRLDWGHRYCSVLCVLVPAFVIVTPTHCAL